jgi:hypothetical protein
MNPPPGGVLDPLLYAALGVVDVLLMAHVARREFAPPRGRREETPCSTSPTEAGGPTARPGPPKSSDQGDAGQVAKSYVAKQESREPDREVI